MNAKYSKVTQLAGGIALGLIIYTVVSKAIKRKNGSKGLLNSIKVNASGTVSCWSVGINNASQCEQECTDAGHTFDGNYNNGQGGCITGGAIWNPASQSERGFGGKFF